eukprot:3403156-Prymnesium_polylepis.1
MAVEHGGEHLLNERGRRALVQPGLVLLHPRHERAARAELQHNVHLAVLFERLQQPADVGVRETLLDLDLATQRLDLFDRLPIHQRRGGTFYRRPRI